VNGNGRNGGMRFSYVMLADYPLQDSLEMIKKADELGFYGCYAADETWHKDLWLLFAAAADKTQNIRFGPSVSPIALREPTLIVQALATLDELTGGRAECVYSIGNFGLLAQYGIDWSQGKPLSRVKEAHHVMRTFLDEGAINHEGEFYNYSGLFTFARPVQEHVPIIVGAMRGPKSFEFAGETADGVHHALSYSREAYDYLVEHVRKGAEKAGRNWQDLDIAAWCVCVVSEDSRAAKDAARAMVGFYISSMPREQLKRHGLDADELQPIVDALGRGAVDEAIELVSPELADTLSLSGSPDEVTQKIKDDIGGAGVNHMILAITDPGLVKAFTGRDIEGVPDVVGQLQLIHDEVMPAFN
jgi:5,10-methylenetetrahydromethanopterin reductase